MKRTFTERLGRFVRRGPAEISYPPVARASYPNPMPPPWSAFPDLEPDSIGWRMGSGEAYLNDFYQWYMQLDDHTARAYLRQTEHAEGWETFFDSYETYRRQKQRKNR